MRTKLLMVFGVGLLGLTAAGWLGRESLQARYYTYRLLHAAGDDSGRWVEQVGSWGGGVADALLDCFARADATDCERAGAALARLAGSWPADDPRPAALAQRLAERFSTWSLPGQQAALECVAVLAEGTQPDVLAACRRVVQLGVPSADAGVRLRSAALALRPGVGAAELLVPLLHDPSAEVRRAALLGVGPERQLVADDDLLPWLHDPDAEVRRLCETALRSRGLRAVDVRLGRLLTDPKPTARLELLTLLRDDGEVDLGMWLRRLSQDPAPAVRAAAARLAGEHQVVQLADRLAEMAQADPDLTVRPIAGYHLRQLQTIQPVGATAPE